MNIQSFCPYGLKSIMECICRATLLSQPADVPDFLLQYLSELMSFRESHPETDPKIVSFNYQEMWEYQFRTSAPVTTTETSPQVPSHTEIDEAMKTLYSDLVSSAERNLVKKSGKNKKPSATPKPPPCDGRKFGKNVPPPFLVVKGERKAAPPPRDVSMKTRRVSTVRPPSQKQSKRTTDDVKKTPGTCKSILPPIPPKTAPRDVSAGKSQKPSKLPSIPVPVVTHRLVLPPIPQKKTRGDTISGKDVSPKPRKGSPMNRDVVPEKTSSRSPARRASGSAKAKPKHKATSVPKSGSSNKPGEPGTESTKTKPSAQKVHELEMRWTEPNGSPERSRGARVLWTDRERVKPVLDRKVVGIKGRAFGSPNHTCPHLAHAAHIIRYSRVQIRASPSDHSGSSRIL